MPGFSKIKELLNKRAEELPNEQTMNSEVSPSKEAQLTALQQIVYPTNLVGPSNPKLTPDILDLIKSSESKQLETYLDPKGKPTIGYGHTGPDVSEGQVISDEQADDYLKNDLNKFESGVKKLVHVPVSDAQHSALVSLAYNIGLNNLKNSSLLKLLNSGDYDGAGQEFLKWNKSGGKELEGLNTRRVAELGHFKGEGYGD